MIGSHQGDRGEIVERGSHFDSYIRPEFKGDHLPDIPYIDPRSSFVNPNIPGAVIHDDHFLKEHGKRVHMDNHVMLSPKKAHKLQSKSTLLKQKTINFRIMTNLNS